MSALISIPWLCFPQSHIRNCKKDRATSASFHCHAAFENEKPYHLISLCVPLRKQSPSWITDMHIIQRYLHIGDPVLRNAGVWNVEVNLFAYTNEKCSRVGVLFEAGVEQIDASNIVVDGFSHNWVRQERSRNIGTLAVYAA